MASRVRKPALWLANTAARITLASGVGYLAAAYTASRFLTKPRHKPILKTPATLDLPFQEITLTTWDGITLHGWEVEPTNAHSTVALFHGMKHNREQMLERIGFLFRAGYRCIAIDHRAHGTSEGKRVSFGWYEARDIEAVEQYVQARWPDQPRCALGISMGAAAIAYAADHCSWNAVILEGIYSDAMLAFRRRIGLLYPKWFGQLFPVVVWLTAKRLRTRVDQFRPAESIVETQFAQIPKLFVTGLQDRLAPPDDAVVIAQACTGITETVWLPEAGHNDVWEKGGELYRQNLLTFLERFSK